ncbi:glyoxalase [Paenibacillus mesophilus]|uniref:VOC family protein n=1 Tax=Paenibacillus mesophilus TaxID=2582849 RepID=UPI00110F14ED|nr:VOC family protein [Paenibacillus mesophilus]TMV50984.1 glyoxalase [Paenibacillus mesophilus]
MMHTYLGLDHVQVAVPLGGEETAKTFYGELLGMEEIPKPDVLLKRGGIWFQCGSHQLHIGVQDEFTAASKAHPAFEVNGIEALRSKLVSHGIEIVEDVPLEGVVRFHIRDPFGNRIEFVEKRL